MIELFLVDRTIAIRIERGEKTAHGTLGIATASAFALRATLALRATFAGRGLRRARRLIVLCEEGTRRKRERHGGGESSVLFHGVVLGV